MKLSSLTLAVLLAGLASIASAQAPNETRPETKAPPVAVQPAPGTTTAKPTENDPVSARREYELATQLRCLVCQNQTIAESNAELAVDLRRQVREQIAAGRSDREIISFMTDRYGAFVLYKPPLAATTVLLWFGPFVLLLVGAFVGWRVLSARRATVAPAPLTEEERARAAALLAGEQRK